MATCVVRCSKPCDTTPGCFRPPGADSIRGPLCPARALTDGSLFNLLWRAYPQRGLSDFGEVLYHAVHRTCIICTAGNLVSYERLRLALRVEMHIINAAFEGLSCWANDHDEAEGTKTLDCILLSHS